MKSLNQIIKDFYTREARSEAQKNRYKNKRAGKRNSKNAQSLLQNNRVKGGAK